MRGFALVRVVAGTVALVGLALAVVVHALSLLGVDVEERVPSVWILHFVGLVVFGLAVLTVVRLTGRRRNFGALLRILPIWGRVLLGAAWLYGTAFVFLAQQSGPVDAPMEQDGRYYANNHGERTELSAEEFHAFRAAKLQPFSAIWLSFLLVSAVILLGARSDPASPQRQTSIRGSSGAQADV